MRVNDFQKGHIYLDTNFIYHFLRPIPDYSHDIMNFYMSIEKGDIHAFTCANTFDELAYRLLIAFIKEEYGGNPLDLLRNHTKDMLNTFYPKIRDILLILKSFPNLDILPLTYREMLHMITNLDFIRLLPRDALHLAVMENHNIYYIASDDRDFDEVQSIKRVWLYNPPLE